MAGKRLLLIDAYSLIHRAYHALAASGGSFTSPSGEPTSAVYGLALMLLKTLSDLKPTYAIAALDTKGPIFREAEFKEYKATRAPMPPALSRQIERSIELLESFSIPTVSRMGYEADDLIATLAKQAPRDTEVIILTGDQDTLQLVSEKVKVLTPRQGLSETILYTPQVVRELKGIAPNQITDLKGLAGDPSDNIPGVAGIGTTGAQKLLQAFGTIESLYKNLKKVPPRYRNALEKGKESAFQSKRLAQLEERVPGIKLKTVPLKPDPRKLQKLFLELGFRSLLTKIPGAIPSEPAPRLWSELPLMGQAAKLDMTLEPILKKMSERGVLVDTKKLAEAGQEITGRLNELKKVIYHLAGQEFNINSPSQLAVILFEKLRLPTKEIKKIKTGLSTAAAELLKLRGLHKIIDFVLEYRELEKLRSTYVEALPKLVDKENRLHTEFTQTTSTGRLASRNPNLQNIPAKGEWGKKIRCAFVAPKGFSLLAADYSQIELRLAAVLSGDKKMIETFKKGRDIHSATAAELFKKKEEEITKEERRLAKTVNFGILYGMGPHGLAMATQMSRGEAQEFIQKYFDSFPKLKSYIQKTLAMARERGYVETLFKRRREIPEIHSPNRAVRAAAEREAINAPIQGSAADIIKKAMIEIERKLPGVSPKSRMILQIHDELLFEVPKGEEEKVGRFIKERMEKIIKLPVPVRAEIAKGDSWGYLEKTAV